jgi:hypothetical protein
MPSALRSIIGKGLVSVSNLPKKALDALGSSIGIGAPIGGPSGNTNNEGIVRTLAAQRGWGSGAEWNSLRALIMGESGFNSNAQNPTSSAYGIFQFLDSTWGSVGASKTSDPWAQTIAGLTYIAGSYGDPINAYAKWSGRSPHWYEKGTPWVPDNQLAYLHKGEAVIPASENKKRVGVSNLMGLVTGKLHRLHEQHLAHVAHVNHVNRVGRPALPPVNRMPRMTGAKSQRLELVVSSGGSAADEFLAQMIRKYVQVNAGGNVQQALGGSR